MANNTSTNLIRQRITKKVDTIFSERIGVDIDSDESYERFKKIEELEGLASIEVNEPGFPIVMFSIALIMDLVDIPQLTGFWYFVMLILNPIFFIVLIFWMRGRLSGMFRLGSSLLYAGPMKKALIRNLNRMTKKVIGKYVSKRLAAILILNFIPGIGILASWGFFVFLAHNKQKKIARGYIFMVEEVGKALKVLERKSRQ